MRGTLHVIGAGLAGLACAVAAAKAGVKVALHEAAPQAGGRCRSFRDEKLDRLIDNGTHLMIGANRNALAFAAAIGGHEALRRGEPVYPFLDLTSGERWVLAPGRNPAGLIETAHALGLPWVPAAETVAVRLGPAPSFKRLWKPLCEAALNTAPEDASARLFARTMRSAMLGGPEALAPWHFPSGLSAAFAAPALATLAVHGAEIRLRHRLMAIDGRDLVFEDKAVRVTDDDRVVLAVPPWALADLLPGIPVPPTRTIVNAHYLVDTAPETDMLGLVGGTAHWLFRRGDMISVTVSAADALAEQPPEAIASILWRDAARALGVPPEPIPPVRVLKERRATMAHTPDALKKRPGPVTRIPWLWLAGDWLQSSWPCTIESAVTSGLDAARLAVGRRDLSFAS